MKWFLALFLLIPMFSFAVKEERVDSFLQLTVEVISTSDWVNVDFVDSINVLTVKHRPTGNEPDKGMKVSMQGVSYQRDGETHQKVHIVADYALKKPEGGVIKLRLFSKIAPATINIYNNKGQLLFSKLQPGDSQVHDETVTLEGSPFTPISNELQNKIEGNKGLNRMIWAFYYLWYRQEWTEAELLDDPVLGKYPSNDDSVMENHIDWAKAAGIDGFIVSWWGPESYTDENLMRFLEIAERKNFKVQVYLESVTFGRTGAAGWSPSTIERDNIYEYLKYLIGVYGNHPALYKFEGKLVIPIYLSFLQPSAWWEQIFEELRAEGYDACFLADYKDEWTNLASLRVFDGIHTYNPLNIIWKPEQTDTILLNSYKATGRCAKYYPLLDNSAKGKIWIPAVLPGYYDRTLEGRKSPVLPRGEQGALYNKMFDAAIASNPDWIFITSWNEWWEHSYIEPSVQYGNLFLEITRKYAVNWKTNTFLAPPE